MADESKTTEQNDGFSDELKQQFDEILGNEKTTSTKKNVDTAYLSDYDDLDPEKNLAGQGDDKKIDDKQPDDDGEEGAEKPKEGEDAVDPETPETDNDEEEIDKRLVIAARARGFSDKRIVELAENSPDVLEAIAELYDATKAFPALRKQETDESKTKAEEPKKPELKRIKLDTDLLDVDDGTRQALTQIEKNYNSLVETVEKLNSQLGNQDENISSLKTQQQQQYFKQVDDYFDAMSKDFPEVGISSKLNSEQTDFRIAVHNEAAALAAAGLYSMPEALDFALKARTSDSAKERLSDNLKRRKKEITNRPSHRRETTKKYNSEEERAMDVIGKKMEEFGIS